MKSFSRSTLGLVVVLLASRVHGYTTDVQALKAEITNLAASIYFMPSEVYSHFTVTSSNQVSNWNYELIATNSEFTFKFYYLIKQSQTYLDFVSRRDSSNSGFDFYFHDDSKPSKYMEYSSGVLNGPHVEFYENGQVDSITHLSAGNFIGEGIQFNEDGALEGEVILTNAQEFIWQSYTPPE